MPSTYAHYTFGRMVQAKLPAELQSITEHHLPLYHIGLHGPDILFYYHPLFRNPVNQTGFRLHKESACVFFEDGLHQLRNMDDPEAGLAYLFGFICHFALDSECHGYIEFKIRHSPMTHTEIESDFDRKLLRDAGYQPERTCLTTHIRPQTGDAETISGFFPSLKPKHINKALSSMIFYNKLLLAPTLEKRDAIQLLLRITGNYTEMHGLLMPTSPRQGCEDSTRELQRRTMGAIPIAIQLCENFFNAYSEIDRLSERFNRTFGPDAIELEKYEKRVL